MALDQEHLWRTVTPQNKPIERPTPETTETRTSYDTALELSEPVEHLFDALLRQERTAEQEETEVLTIKTEMATDTSMGGPSANPFTQAFPLTEETAKATEIKLNQLKPFTSDCQGLAKPLGLEGRVQRVRVRVGTSVPLANPYP